MGGADCDTHEKNPTVTLLAWSGKENEDKLGKPCHEQHKHLSPFSLTSDCMLGKEAPTVLANLRGLMAEKTGDPFHMCKTGLIVGSKFLLQDCTPI